ncbi:MAG: hypothetical protein ACYCYO_01560 [Bacilli bacterium]
MDEVGSGCMRCGSADGELYKWTYVSTNADEVVRLCQPCFEHALDRQRLAVEENTDVLQSASVSSAEHKELEVNWWMMVGGAVVVVTMITFSAWTLFGASASPQGLCPGPCGPYYNPVYSPPNSNPYAP